MDEPRRRSPGAGTRAGDSKSFTLTSPAASNGQGTQLEFLTEAQRQALQALNHRLAIVRDRVRGVALSHHPGFYLCGRAGSGKTHTVRTTLESLGVRYHYHVGHLTPLGLFELLAQLPDRVIVLDDVSAIFTQPIALQILLAALGQQPPGTGGRIIQYRRQGRVIRAGFVGGIICLSNLTLHPNPLLTAIKSRVHYLRYDPTDEQLAACMLAIAQQGWPAAAPQLSPVECVAIANYLIDEAQRLACPLDLRLLIDKAFPDYLQFRRRETETHWHDLITSTLKEQLTDLRHPPRVRLLTRRERKAAEQQLVQSLLAQFPTPQARVSEWQQQTQKSARAFYRRLAELDLRED